jgi:hypothetical protein
MPDRAAGILVLLTALAFSAAATAATAKPTVDRVPTTISQSGFSITGCCAFRPALSAPGLISARKAVALASAQVDTKNWQKPTAVLAKLVGPVTFGFTTKVRTVRNPTAWVVTFTGRDSVHVGLGPGGAGPKMSHDTVVLDAKTGEFIRGFYTA